MTNEIVSDGHRPCPTPLLAGAAVAVVQAAVVVPFLGRYGWDRDELYFLSAARRPAWGYVDFPPVTAWIAWVVHAAFRDSLDALRLVSLAAMLTTTVLVALLARELGGGVRVQALAAAVWGLGPYGLSGASLFHTTWFDSLCWVTFLYVVTVALVRERPRLWVAAGAVAGVGLETKYTIGVLIAALAAALLATSSRRVLATRWPWLGLGVAVALFAPNLVWQARHGWPSVHFAASQNAATAGDTPPATYLAEQFLLGVGFLVAAVGVVSLWRRGRGALALVPAIVTVLFLLERGRAYYPLPADSVAIAAGCVALGDWAARATRGRRIALAAALALLQAGLLFVALPVVVPVRSTASMVASGVWKSSWYKDEIGWPELAAETARAWRELSPAARRDGVVLAGNYGEASALELYGRGLPPILSGHLSWQYWRPRVLPQRFALLVGFARGDVLRLCASSRTLATIDNRWHLGNEERGRTIVSCRLVRPLGALWRDDIARSRL